MKSLKKVLAIVLVLLTLTASVVMLNSCSKVTSEHPGAVIDLYLPYTVNLDPATAYADEASAKLLSLLYEGLTRISSKGKVEGAIADEWRIYENRDKEQCIEFKLNTTRWSDGQRVNVTDFIDAWERMLEPSFNCEAASLLFPVKNAAAVKRGEKTLSDLGLEQTAVDVLTVKLEDGANPEVFLRNCASVALYPIRKDVINKIYDRTLQKENDWSTVIAIMQTNGPFFLKGVSFGAVDSASTRPYMILERNISYYLDPEKSESLDKYVVPYRIHVNMSYGGKSYASGVDAAGASKDFIQFINGKFDAYKTENGGENVVTEKINEIKAGMTEEELAALGTKESEINKALKPVAETAIKNELVDLYATEYTLGMLDDIRENMDYFYSEYNEGEILVNGNLPLNQETAATPTATVESMMAGAFYFNTENELLDDPKVRQALSLALDREAIASLSKKGTAAGTLITNGVFETDRKTSFINNSKSYALSTKADVEAAKSLLKDAGVSGGSFTITVRPVESDIVIAQAAAEAWNALGFTVGVRICGYSITNYTELTLVTDKEGNVSWVPEIIFEGILHDTYVDAYHAGDFDVILCDVNMLSPDAFAVLAQFAGIYSCRAYDLTDVNNFDKLVTGVTGYYDPEYDKIMEQALKTTDLAARAKLLHDAEAKILKDLPITPVIHYTSSYMISDELEDVEFDYFGAPIFSDTGYENYVEETDAPTTTVVPSTSVAPSTSAAPSTTVAP